VNILSRFRSILFIILAVFFYYGFLNIPDAHAFPKSQLVYKGMLSTVAGKPVADGKYNVIFSIYTVDSGGSVLWSESQTITSSRGIFTAVLGTSNPVNLDFEADNYYLGIKVGSDSEMTPRQQIGAAPFALNAKKLNNLEAGTGANNLLKLGENGEINIGGAISGGSLSTDGTLNVGNNAAIGGALNVAGNLTAPNILYSVAGTSGRITVSSGQNPVINIASDYIGQTSITTLGTITTGVWHGAPINLDYTDLSVSDPIVLVSGSIGLSYNSTNLKLTTGALNTIQNIAASSAPTFAGLTLSNMNTAGIVKNSAGGVLSGGNSITPSDIATSDLVQGTGISLSGTLTGRLIESGSNVTISMSASVPTSVSNDTNVTGSIAGNNLTLGWSGLLGSSRGGTNNNTYTNNKFLVYDGTKIASSVYDSTSFFDTSGGTMTGSLNFSGVANDITTSGSEDLTINAGGTGKFVAADNALFQGTLGIIEGGLTPTKYTYFQGGDQIIDLTYTLPTAYPTLSGYVLSSTDAGVMSWVAQSGGADSWTDGGTYLYPTNRESMRVYDAGGTDYIDIAHDGTDAILSFANTTALNINIGVIDLSNQTVDLTLNNAVDALNFDSNTLSIDASSNRVGIGTASPSTLLQLGTAGTAGVLSMAGSASGLVTLQTAAAAGTWAMTLPTSAGTNGFVLSTNGAGVTSWVPDGAGSGYWTANGADIYNNNIGAVGMGTTGPDRKLDVLDAANPQLRLTQTDGTVYTDLFTDASGNLALHPSGQVYKFATDDGFGDYLRLAGTNNTGLFNFSTYKDGGAEGDIGFYTSHPDRHIDVLDAANPQLRLTQTDGTVYTDLFTDTSGNLAMFPTSQVYKFATDGSFGDYLKLTAPNNTGLFYFSTYQDGIATGDIGFYTSSPDRHIDVLDAANPQLRLTQTDGTVYTDLFTDTSGNLALHPTSQVYKFATDDGFGDYLRLAGTNNTGLFNFSTYKDGGAEGDIGFYTSHPDRHVDILDGANPQLRLTQTDGTRYTDFQTDSNGYLVISPSGARTGIGRGSTANTLEVEGDASKTVAGTWAANSDARIKTDIQSIDDAVSVIMNLKPVKFKYSDWYMSQHPSIKNQYYYNYIAQDFAKVFPDSVKGSGEYLPDGSEILQVDSYDAEIFAIAAIQEQNIALEDLQSDVELLQTVNSDISTLVDNIEVISGVVNIKKLAVSETATFTGKLIVDAEVAFNADTVGEAKILTGADRVHVTFQYEYEYQPIVTITNIGSHKIQYQYVDNVTTTGFDIVIDPAQTSDAMFSWHAFGSSNGKISVSDGTTENIQIPTL